MTAAVELTGWFSLREQTGKAVGGRMISFTVNGKVVGFDADRKTPLLWVIRDYIGLTGTKYGCGGGFCGACTVHINGRAQRSCQIPVAKVAGAKVVTIEGLSPDSSHPLQKAWIAAEVPQCGYCQSGQIMKAAELLTRTPKPTREQIVQHMDGNICRCGTYNRIIAAIQHAAREG
jgi:isoquinoline 1-oxidoreductase alpha subunit